MGVCSRILWYFLSLKFNYSNRVTHYSVLDWDLRSESMEGRQGVILGKQHKARGPRLSLNISPEIENTTACYGSLGKQEKKYEIPLKEQLQLSLHASLYVVAPECQGVQELVINPPLICKPRSRLGLAF